MTNWGNWKITDEQATAIYNGDKDARDKFYFDNLDKIKAMAYTHCLKRPYCRGYLDDMVNGVYVDLTIFESNINQPVNNLFRLNKFIYASFNACPRGGLAYLYEHNRKLLSGKKEYFIPVGILPLDAPINFASEHKHDGGQCATIADILPAPELLNEEDYEIIKQIVCRHISPRFADYVGYYVEGYAPIDIRALTGKKSVTTTSARKELVKHCKAILDDLCAVGFNVEYYYKIDPNKKTEKRYKRSPEEREKGRIQSQKWRAKQKALAKTSPDVSAA